ncbi:MAG: RNA methyltransferase, partial [Bacteroidaceae bacterium]|nr:RNA methyltransferase [Bacteroidaceae bacterium]
MISKNDIKFVHSLELKKKRREENAFVAEGPKLVGELIGTFRLRTVYALSQWIEANEASLNGVTVKDATQDELRKISFLETPQEVVAVFEQPDYDVDARKTIAENLCIALDGVQNPGNLGTIVRLADWFGISDVFCSVDTADIFNPKTVQATMGGMARVRVH